MIILHRQSYIIVIHNVYAYDLFFFFFPGIHLYDFNLKTSMIFPNLVLS